MKFTQRWIKIYDECANGVFGFTLWDVQWCNVIAVDRTVYTFSCSLLWEFGRETTFKASFADTAKFNIIEFNKELSK